jgi:tricorn protease
MPVRKRPQPSFDSARASHAVAASRCCGVAIVIALLASVAPRAADAPPLGYFRFPALAADVLIFTAEGDLWKTTTQGGVPERVTAHPGQETNAVVSPDGKSVAFTGTYEGPRELYVLPLEGGVPKRLTWDGGPATAVGWTPGGRVLYATDRYSTLPSVRLFEIDPVTGAQEPVPLAQASDGAYAADGTLFFTRLPFQGSNTRRYRGGTAQQIWRFARGTAEAEAVTGDFPGTSKQPMVWNDRVYFLSDRDGTMNIWSMTLAGGGLAQHTRHAGYEAQSASLSNGRIAYQHGADIRIFDIASNADRVVPIRLVSDFDHVRDRWVTTPLDWVTAAHLSPTGDRVVFTARGQLFVAPVEQGRLVEATRNSKVRYRNGRFMPDGASLIGLSDESGEVEFWRVPANGIGASTQLTSDGAVLRWDGLPSPDGKRLAHYDKDQQLWVLDLAAKTQTKVAASSEGDFDDLAWSPDSRFLAYTAAGPNQLARIYLWEVATGRVVAATSDRYDSVNPAWSRDSQWLYFLSDRNFDSLVRSPWGSRQPEPFYDKQTLIYHIPLVPGARSPFQPADELHKADKKEDKKDDEKKTDETTDETKPDEKKAEDKKSASSEKPKSAPPSKVDLTDLVTRIIEVPVPAGNYSNLSVDAKRLYLVDRDTEPQSKRILKTLALDPVKPELETFLEDVRGYELSADGKKVLVRREKDFVVLDAGAKAPAAAELAKKVLPIGDWRFKLEPRTEWRQMFTEAWRLERDYFYDRQMHGVDWTAIREKYAPLVERVTDRAELSDVLAQMVSELSALHIFVYGGDQRSGTDDVTPASLGARTALDKAAGGHRVTHIFASDPDLPDQLSPLRRPGVGVQEGDVITHLNGAPTVDVSEIGQFLRGQAGKQVLLDVKPKSGATRQAIVVPISRPRDNDLRYDEWEYTRRLEVETASQNRIGYVHLRAMGAQNMAEWTREYYPVFNREGLIIDVRSNRGGNIDSWLLARLLRRAWFYWQPRVGHPYWNMQFAFRGHLVVLVNEFTASDGEAFAEGFRRLGLGKVIGTRTWGGEIWLSSSNVLVDRGIATAAEFGVYGPEGTWLIEGHGVDPDIVVDNLPHATYKGEDAQLRAAIQHLEELIKTRPVPVPPAPRYPDKRLQTTDAGGKP